MDYNSLYYPMNIVAEGIDKVEHGARKFEYEDEKYLIKVYLVNSSAKYSHSSLRVDIQNLELRSY